jgi:hypothetical protein
MFQGGYTMRKIVQKALSFVVALTLLSSGIPSVFAEQEESGLILHYSFDGSVKETEDGVYVEDESGKNNSGALFGNVTLENGYAFFDGTEGSYIKMPNAIVAGEENVSFVINVKPKMGKANQFVYTIGNSDSTGYLFLNTNNTNGVCRFAITPYSYWNGEVELTAPAVEEGDWASIVVTMEGKTAKIYKDGEFVAETETGMLVSSLGDTAQNYIAKSQFSGDNYFKGYIDDFRIYSYALTEDEIKEIASEHKASSEAEDEYIAVTDLEKEADTISFDSMTVTSDISLPPTAGNATVSWKSGNADVIDDNGIVTRQEADVDVTMTATVTSESGNSVERSFVFTVLHLFSDEENVKADIESLTLVGNLKHLKENLYLPTVGECGSTIKWISDDESVITSEGVINQAEIGGGEKSATLTAEFSYGEYSETTSFDVTVEEMDYAYLFAYFTGNSPTSERLFYGLSLDGYNFNTLNNGNAVLIESVGTGCLRDPYIFKGQDGLYYCLVTDMQSSLGWNSNYAMTVWSSKDLITWENETRFDFRELFSDIAGYSEIDRVWAPQAIWDPEYVDENGEKGAYMIYLALRIPQINVQTQMYKVYTKDFKTLISKPERFYCHDENKSDIDADIIYKDGLYYMYVKDESDGGVYVVTSEHAGGPYSDRIASLPAKKSNGSSAAIEGSGIYKLIGQDKYNIVYDAYTSGFFVMTETENLTEFNQLKLSSYGFDFTPRHGYVVTISKEECEALMEKYGVVIPEEAEKSDDPIIYYDFEEDGSDVSGNFHDAALKENASIAYEGGISGNALYLDGSSNSYVSLPGEVLSSLYDYTVSAWIKPESDNTTQRIFDFGTGSSRYMFFTPYYNSTSCRYAITTSSYSNENGITVEEQIPTDEWTLVTVTSEGDKISLYINGKKVGEEEGVTLDPYEISSSMTQCYIGKSQYSADSMYKGYIDEFKVYNRALSDDEVKNLYRENASFHFDVEEDGSTVVLTVTSDMSTVEKAVAVIAEYNDEGILVKVVHKNIDFSENKTASVSLEVESDNYKVFLFDSTESLKPIK